MRENLFKGKVVAGYKHIAEGEWVEGSLFYTDDEYGTVCYIATSYLSSDKDEPMMVIAYEVDSETVCQYTGLTDEEGKRFERDIFQASDGDFIQRYIIVWNEDSLEWSAECVGNPEGTLPLSEFKVREIYVIGNIFDNPDLLKE